MPSKLVNDLAQPKRFIRRPEVRHRTGLSDSGLYERIGRGEFPRPVKLPGGSSVAWIESEVDAWIDAAIAARDKVIPKADTAA